MGDDRRAARQEGAPARLWGDHVPAGPEFFAEPEDGRLEDRREKAAAWADEEFTVARTELFLAGLGRESLGWLFIDEAGQAPPQQAVGGIWRASRAVVVGDPLELEPVVTLPWGGQRALLRLFGVDREWAPGLTSVQQVADRLAPYGTSLPAPAPDGSGAIWVGTPLRVHRRCDRPMFDISNQIAYDGLMVFGTPERPSFRGSNIWYDVRSHDAGGYWIPAEGDALRDILTSLRDHGTAAADIRVISPFRQAAEGAARTHREVFPDGIVSPDDRKKWVGTVHTIQGKEADVVIVVLGGNPDRPGARKFAAEGPNLLNVAVSRACRRLYVIGNRQAWSGERYFDVLAAHVPPAAAAEPPLLLRPAERQFHSAVEMSPLRRQ